MVGSNCLAALASSSLVPAFALLSRLAAKLSSNGCSRSSISGCSPPKIFLISLLRSFLAEAIAAVSSLRVRVSASLNAFLAASAALVTTADASFTAWRVASAALAVESAVLEQSSIPVDRDLLCGLLGSGGVVGPFDEFAVLELRAGADERHEMGRVDRPPA